MVRCKKKAANGKRQTLDNFQKAQRTPVWLLGKSNERYLNRFQQNCNFIAFFFLIKQKIADLLKIWITFCLCKACYEKTQNKAMTFYCNKINYNNINEIVFA